MSRSRDIADAGAKVNYLDNVTASLPADVASTLALKAPLASPTFTGTTDISSGATFPAGHVLQVQIDINSTLNTLTASTAERDTGISVSLTPKVSGSKILVLADLTTGVAIATGLGLIIKRTGPSTTNLQAGGSGTHQYGKAFYYAGTEHDGAVWSATGHFTDTAQDDSTAHVYNMYVQTNNSAIVPINKRESDTLWGSTSSIIAMEIKA